MRLAGKRVLVTGSTMGIGYGAAEGLLSEGARVVVHGRDQGRVEEAIQKLGGSGDHLFGVTGDVGNLADCRVIVDRSVELLGGLDCLVNNAGVADLSYPEDVTDEHWQRISDVNLRSCFFLTQYALPELEKSRGSVIMTASIASMSAGPTDSFCYAIFKKALAAMARSLAIELAPRGIRVNSLCPGYIDTPLVAAENAATDGQVYEFINQCVPMGRIGSIAECASSIVFLASDEATYFSGSTITPDGGASAIRSWGGRN